MPSRSAVPALGVLLALAGAAPAEATTFCVPAFHAACAAGGGNVAVGSVETAMQTSAVDGVGDRVIIAAGTYTDDETFERGEATTSTSSAPARAPRG